MSDQLIVSSSGIRGVVGSGLTPGVASRYGAAYGSWLTEEAPVRGGPGRALVGRDTRTSGEVLADAVAAGLRAAGVPVRDVGVVPTPTALLAVEEDPEAGGGIIITASHNPVEWNGLKLASPDGRFVSPAGGRRVQRLYESGPAYVGWDRLGDRTAVSGAIDRHLERILSLSVVDPEAVARSGFRVAVDCVHGAGGLILPRLLERLGCRMVGIGMEPDGRFPRNPEPAAAHLGELGTLVRESEADLGLAVDPDADRLALVDGEGRPVGEDWTLALAVEHVLSRTPGPVVTNLSSSSSIRDAAVRHGQPLYRAPVGEANVAALMQEVGAVVGGEGNGGVMLPELHSTRDAPLAAALVLQLLADRGASLGELLSGWSGYHIAKRKAARPGGPLTEVYRALEEAAPAGAEIDRQDGIRLEWPDGRWVHLRPSGTEPIVRIVAEAEAPAEAQALVEWAEDVLRRRAQSDP